MDMHGIKTRVDSTAGSVRRFFTSLFSKPFFAKLINYTLRFGIGFMLPRGIVLGDWSPFALAFAASLGSSEGAVLGIIGVMLGYFRILSSSNGLKYIAICILIYTAGFIFRGTSLMKKAWFMPLCGAICTAAVGFVFVAESGFPTVETVFFLSEVALVTLCTCAYQFYFNPNLENRDVTASSTVFRGISLILLTASILLCLADIELVAQMSLGRMLAVLFIMVSGYYGGIGVGSCAGIILGLIIGISDPSPSYCAIYGFAGVTAAVFSKKGKLLYTVVYLISNAGAMFWVTAGTQITVLYEAFFASVLFLLVGELFSGLPLSVDTPAKSDNTSSRARDFTQKQLTKAAQAFSELGDMLHSSIKERNGENSENITSVFNRPAAQICRNCQLSSACWEQDYISTRDALNNVTQAMKERGRLEASDLPLHFTSRCIHLNKFLEEVNRELIAYGYRRQFRNRIAESRRIICRQYKGMSDIFDKISAQISKQPKFDLRGEENIRRCLHNLKPCPRVCVYRDSANHVYLQIEGNNLAPLFEKSQDYLSLFSDVLGVSLIQAATSQTSTCFSARQAEPLCALIGVAVHKKKDSPMSGDSGSYFKLEDGRLCVILSDGMGSGKEAAAESSSAIRMLERFLKSGIDPAISLATINSALVIKNTETGGFATLDFMCLDLFTGDCNFYKYGTAPTYIKRGKHVRRIVSTSLPVGISPGGETHIEKTHIKLHNGDTVVLASDGVADSADDVWLQTLLSDYSGESARELASQLMDNACSRYGRSDDMTVMTVRIKKSDKSI